MKRLILAILLVFPTLGWGRSRSTVDHIREVTPGIYRGGRPLGDDRTYLLGLGVQTVISLQGGDIQTPGLAAFIGWWEPGERPENIAEERAFFSAHGVDFINMPINSLMPITGAENAMIDEVLNVMHDSTALPVFVHCEHGKDRTGMIVALYRVKYEGWTVERAYAEWLAAGHMPIAQIFTGNLDKYFFAKAKSFAISEISLAKSRRMLVCEQYLRRARLTAR